MAEEKVIYLDSNKVRELVSLLVNAIDALKPLANIPLEEMLYKRPDQPLMGWNGHMLYVRDVHKARAIIKHCEDLAT
jgi:hypothetical protein